ncbi:MAG: hypothetical protein WCP85_23360 [Mariniphaga sp.]
MKKLKLSLLAMIILLAILPSQSFASIETTLSPAVSSNTLVNKDVSVMISRVEAIKAMDKSELTSTEKKELRKELRTIKSNLAASSKADLTATGTGGGLYLSVGAIIIIILLLILLL